MKVLVCGGRDFNDREAVNNAMYCHQEQYGPFTCVIDGGARGADTLGFAWAHNNGITTKTFKADWGKHGRAAGPIRNQQMIDEGKPDLVIAFPGGEGTSDMISRAEKAGIRVIRAR